MWKMYLRSAHGGGSSAFWDAEWDRGSFRAAAENDRVCQNQGGVFRALTAAVRSDRLFLEGGCGMADWVRYFHARGHRALGIDFAANTVARVNELAPEVDVRRGDVTAFDLPDGAVHTYYSGGVVEHFEAGPGPALREARRVLTDDGWFLCSVPDASALRSRVLFPLRRFAAEAPQVRRVDGTRIEPAPPGSTFYQYLFDRDEFAAELESAGFRVERDFGCFLVWGLQEIPGVRWSIDRARGLRRGRSTAAAANDAAIDSGAAGPVSSVGLRRLIERVALQEDTSTPVVGAALAWLLEHGANMRLFVARPR